MAVSFDKKKKTWSAVIKYTSPITGKVQWKRKRGFRLKHDALRWESDMKDSVKASAAGGVTFREAAKLWEDSNQTSEGTRTKHAEHFQIRFAEYYDSPIEAITKQDLARWRTDLIKGEWSTATKNHTISYVRSVFRYMNEIYGTPNVSIALKSLKRTDQEQMTEMQVWTPEEFDKFIACVDPYIYKLYFELLFWTGMRKGEAIALQKADLDGEWLNIHATQKTLKQGLKPTKTRQNRKIRIDKTLTAELEPLRTGSGYLFGGETSLSPSTIDRYFAEGIRRSGVKKIRIHDLRHSHATWLINNGVNIVAVSKRLGHTTIEQTLKTYTHLLQSADDQMMNIIEACRHAE